MYKINLFPVDFGGASLARRKNEKGGRFCGRPSCVSGRGRGRNARSGQPRAKP